MKTLLAGILLFALYDATAIEIKVSKMGLTPGFDRKFDLQTSFDKKVSLDCQSFIQGLFFGDKNSDVLMLEEWECEELMKDMYSDINNSKSHCLEVDFDRSTLDHHEQCN